MEKSSKKVIGTTIGVIAILAIVYFFLLQVSFAGWGYSGYGGYYGHPSFFYMGGHSVYYEPSVRNGSRSGPGHVGGGVKAGK